MHVFGEAFLNRAGQAKDGRGVPVINLHPALPGAFDGTNSIERAYEAFQKGEVAHSGAMVHRVVKDVDRGEPLIVREVPILQGEALDDFAQRLHAVEWEIIVQASKQVLDQVLPIPVRRFHSIFPLLANFSTAVIRKGRKVNCNMCYVYIFCLVLVRVRTAGDCRRPHHSATLIPWNQFEHKQFHPYLRRNYSSVVHVTR
jgi:phosphoribosylglycinamide formyltransferase